MTALRWNCDRCELEIDDGDGILQIDSPRLMREIHDERRRHQEHAGDDVETLLHRAELDLRAALDHVDETHLEALHFRCDPDENSPHYWIRIENLRTTADVLERTAHLIGKPWFRRSGWDDLLRRLATQIRETTPLEETPHARP